MGHRALIAYERPDGLYNLQYSNWDALRLQLKHEITPETPFGGPDIDSGWARSRFRELVEEAPGPVREGCRPVGE